VIDVAAARAIASARLGSRRSTWATEPPSEAPVLTVPLRPPSEREARADQAAAQSWAREWLTWPVSDGADVEWASREWRTVGRQRLPVRLHLRDPDAVAAFVGGRAAAEWTRLRDRAATIRDHLHGADPAALATAIRRHAATLIGYGDREFDQVLAAAAWVIGEHVRGLRPRQLPIRGVDSKWFGAHRSVVSALAATSGVDDLGIVDADPLVRVRVLDPSLLPGGPLDFAAPVAQLQLLALAPRGAFVFENLESVLAMPAWPGAIAIHGSGYAVGRLRDVPWLARTPVVYWGDVDSNGFAILHQLRAHHDDVRSALMDEETLRAHSDLWVVESQPARGRFAHLTESEERTLAALRAAGDVRLEQERVPWQTAVEALSVAWAGLPSVP